MSVFRKFEEKLMRRLIKNAALYQGDTGLNPVVSAAVYNDDMKIIAIASHEREGESHAEVRVLNLAGSLAHGQYLMVTLEPCSHKGRTGACTDSIIKAKISKVIYAIEDPNPLVRKQASKQVLESAGIQVEAGLLQDEARELNKVYFMNMQEKRSFVTMKIAMSLDGMIAPSSRNSRFITGKKSLKQVHQLRGRHHAILVGLGTIMQDDPSLNLRFGHSKNKNQPLKIIVDPYLKTPTGSKAVDSNCIFVHEKGQEIRPDLKNSGARFWPIIEPNYDLDWFRFFRICLKEKIASIFIEGGQQIFSSLLKTKAFDEFHIFLAPIFIAGSGALSPFSINSFIDLNDSIKLERLKVSKRCAPDIWIQGRLKRADKEALIVEKKEVKKSKKNIKNNQ